MAIIRLSCDRSQLFAPDKSGLLIDQDYSPRQEVGRLESLPYNDTTNTFDRDGSKLSAYLESRLKKTTASLPDGAPIVVMVHGFLFDPHHVITPQPENCDNAHGRLYHFKPVDEDSAIRHHTASWPLGLGIKDDDGQSGLAIAFGWHSKPGLAQSLLERFQNFYARAYDYGNESAWVLANVLNRLASSKALEGRPIDILCHSLGTHVVTRAIAMSTKFPRLRKFIPRLGRVIQLGGAEYVVEAQLMYRRVLELGMSDDAGPTFYNIGCRENDVLDKLGENFGPRTFGNTNVIGHNGLDAGIAQRWIDLQIDSGPLRDWMSKYDGLDISGDQPWNVWDHWYYYTHSGNMFFYRRLLRQRDKFAIPMLRSNLPRVGPIPEGIEQGWLFGD